jgi:tight adherence protein C
MHIGYAQFGPFHTCILVIALSGALLSVLNLWRIGQNEDRADRLNAVRGVRPNQRKPEQTSSARWYHRLGAIVATTPIFSTVRQEKLLMALASAGIKGQHQLAGLITGKLCTGAAFVALFWLALEWNQFVMIGATLRVGVLGGTFIIGWRLPEVILSRLIIRRRARLELGLPDALDLLVICVEAGLSLDQAIEQVGRELRSSNLAIAGEFTATATEMRILADRGQALKNFSRRVGLLSLRSIIATLNQSIKFGTPLAASLRVLAAEMRAERLTRFEERAARLPVLLTIPLMGLILPSLMIVIGTPLVLRTLDMLGSLSVQSGGSVLRSLSTVPF